MKTALATLIVLAAAGGARLLPCRSTACFLPGAAPAAPAERPADPAALVARYVEARTASVFAGACHYNGEYTTQGRRAALALAIESGEHGGVDLAGLACAAAVTADDNLAEAGPRRSVLFVPRGLDATRREALVALARAELGAALGTVERVEDADLRVEVDGERFRVRAGDALTLEGAALPDRACCKMPLDVWYDPLAPVRERLVGTSATFAVDVPSLGPAIERHDANDAFLGVLAPERPAS